jgi:hypothetical protein
MGMKVPPLGWLLSRLVDFRCGAAGSAAPRPCRALLTPPPFRAMPPVAGLLNVCPPLTDRLRTSTQTHNASATPPRFRSPRKPPEDEREIKRDDEIRALPPSEQAVQLRKKRMYLKQRAEEARADAEGSVPILAPEPALAPSFDADVTGYRYRVLEDPSGIIARCAPAGRRTPATGNAGPCLVLLASPPVPLLPPALPAFLPLRQAHCVRRRRGSRGRHRQRAGGETGEKCGVGWGEGGGGGMHVRQRGA